MPTYEYRSLKAKVLLSYCATPECSVTATSICFVFLNWYVRHAKKSFKLIITEKQKNIPDLQEKNWIKIA